MVTKVIILYVKYIKLFRTNNSLAKALKEFYPDHQWTGRDQIKPYGYWNSFENRLKFVKDLEAKYNIKEPADWYNITVQTVFDNDGGGWMR
jgi:hypothetical protein